MAALSLPSPRCGLLVDAAADPPAGVAAAVLGGLAVRLFGLGDDS